MGPSGVKPSYLIDTVILIDHLNGIEASTQWLASLRDGQAAISVITRAEVLVGLKPAEKASVNLLLESFACLPTLPQDADRAAQLRQKHRWKLPDAFQAAIALQNDFKLVTRNTESFPPAKHSFVEVPYEL
jgi:predicted nucleic acid-binding protein